MSKKSAKYDFSTNLNAGIKDGQFFVMPGMSKSDVVDALRESEVENAALRARIAELEAALAAK